MRLYYLIWVDCLIRLKSQPSNKNNWQVLGMVFITTLMAVDFLFVMIVLQEATDYYFYTFEIPVLPKEIGELISFIILFAVPPSLINYLLIFRNRRYERLMKKYKYHQGKLFITYMAIGLCVPVAAVWIGIVF